MMTDFDGKSFGEDWLLTPTNRAARAWCQSNLTEEFRKAGDGYVVTEQRLLMILDEYGERKTNWFGF